MIILLSTRLLLRPLTEADLNETYVDWLNNPVVNAYLETRFEHQTMESVRAYWRINASDPKSYWWAICRRDQHNRHIGNIKLGPVHSIYKRADISLFIGDSLSWGLGLGSEAITLVRNWSLEELSLHKLSAGIYSCNYGSRRAFEKCGFQLEGILREEVITFEGNRVDILRYGLLRQHADFIAKLDYS